MFTTDQLNKGYAEFVYKCYKPQLDYVESIPETELKRNRLYHCSAYVVRNDDIIVLRSYSTAVAWYVPDDNTVYVLGRYSSTTYQHIRKFEDFLYYEKHYEKLFASGKEINLKLVDNWGCYDTPLYYDRVFKW